MSGLLGLDPEALYVLEKLLGFVVGTFFAVGFVAMFLFIMSPAFGGIYFFYNLLDSFNSLFKKKKET